MKRILNFLCVIFFYACLASNIVKSEASPVDTVTIQLKWFHQFQFAGYYAALEKGFYAEEGLDVVLKERNPQGNQTFPLLNGDAEYGISDTSLLLYRIQGEPVVLLQQIFQHSPVVLITKKESGIVSPYEMVGKKVMFAIKGGGKEAVATTLLMDTLGDLSRIQKVEHSFDFNDLVTDKVDVISAYLTAQPLWFKKKGVEINIIDPRNYGIDFYGDNLFTTEQEIRNHPGRVEKIIRATRRGWKYAIENQDEIIDLILEKYNPKLDRDQLQFEADQTIPLLLADIIPVGTINPRRYQRLSETYTRLGIIEEAKVPEGFIYKGSFHKPTISLTEKEKTWLRAHPNIKFGFPKGFEPLLIKEKEGGVSGILADFLADLNDRLGTQFTAEIDPVSEILKKIDQKELSGILIMIPAAADEYGLLKTKATFPV